MDHVLVYSIGLIVMCILNSHILLNATQLLAFVAINAVAHFFTDFVTSRATSSLYKDERYNEFFSTIGLDQFIHYYTLFTTLKWVITI